MAQQHNSPMQSGTAQLLYKWHNNTVPLCKVAQHNCYINGTTKHNSPTQSGTAQLLQNWHRTIVTQMAQRNSSVAQLAQYDPYTWHRTTNVTQLAWYDSVTHMAQHNNNCMQIA